MCAWSGHVVSAPILLAGLGSSEEGWEMSLARWPRDQVSLSYREKAGSRQPPTLSDGDRVRPASSTPRQELTSLFCPVSGILTLEPPCTQTNGEGAADHGRRLLLMAMRACFTYPSAMSPSTQPPCLLTIPICLPPLPSGVFWWVEHCTRPPLLRPPAGNTGAS